MKSKTCPTCDGNQSIGHYGPDPGCGGDRWFPVINPLTCEPVPCPDCTEQK